jgi:hypothetical protein
MQGRFLTSLLIVFPGSLVNCGDWTSEVDFGERDSPNSTGCNEIEIAAAALAKMNGDADAT